jgi:deoxyribose-phosphate aldolase
MIDVSKLDKRTLAGTMDFSILPKNTQKSDILKGCELTRKYGFAAFYSSSAYWSPLVVAELAGTSAEIGTGIAFPFGGAPSAVKAFEVEDAVRRGCTAVDLVLNVGALKDKDYDVVRGELQDFVRASGGAVTKAILEVCFLSDEDIVAACKLIAETGVRFAKTSTGQFEGPDMRQFLIMKKALAGTGVKLKVAGIKFPRPQNAMLFLLAGADRLGTRAAPEIVDALDQMKEIGLVR